ncbi:MAG: MarR family transcriptional regulator [Candidatus Omnitrophota bacterium]
MEENNFGSEISRLLPVIIREFGKQQSGLLSNGALTIHQLVILDLLLERKSCNMSEISRGLNLTMSAATAIIDKMIGSKLVKRERSTEDRRVVRVIMQAKGRDIIDKINKGRRDLANNVFSVLTASEKSEYLRFLKKVCDSIKQAQNEQSQS